MRAQFLVLEHAKEGCDELNDDAYVTCIVPVSVEETFWWKKAEYPVRRLRDQLALAHKMEAHGVKLDTTQENDKGIPTLGRKLQQPKYEGGRGPEEQKSFCQLAE